MCCQKIKGLKITSRLKAINLISGSTYRVEVDRGEDNDDNLCRQNETNYPGVLKENHMIIAVLTAAPGDSQQNLISILQLRITISH